VKLDAFFFDFDGVILDSANIKTEAMRSLFAEETPAKVDAIVALHLRYGGISRYQKFDMIYADILKRPLSADRRNALGERFREAVFDAVLKCPEVAGARDFLATCWGKLPLYVVSGTPEDELRDIVRHRGLDSFFAEVHGTPRSKPEIVGDILARHGYSPERCMFVGDAQTDFAAAQECGLHFAGVVPPGSASPFPGKALTVPDLTGFERTLRGAGFAF
jgi:phosphoglycolate phosphatase-like HAD superfamily hydrolase